MPKEILSRHMLCLSAHVTNGQLHLLLESEPYYPDEARAPHTESPFSAESNKELASDDAFLSDLGFNIVLALLSKNALNDKHDGKRARYIYAFQSRGQPTMRMDRYLPGHHPYRPDPRRTFCAKILLPGLNDDDLFQDDVYRRLAEAVVQHLPLDPSQN